jgi:hypothetical protein
MKEPPIKQPRTRPQPGAGPINYAWIIANSNYDFRNGLGEHPFSDARRLKDSLMRYNFSEDNIIIQKDLTRKGILKGFQDIAGREKKSELDFTDIVREKDNLFIYFSGHGDKIKIGNSQMGFWVPTDASANWDYIPDYEIKALLNMLELNQVLLVSDSCFSGMLLNSERAGAIMADLEGPPSPCLEVITSGNNRVPARSDFLSAFADLLDSNPNDVISSNDIYEFVRTQLSNNRHYQPQFGSLSDSSVVGQYRLARQEKAKVILTAEELKAKMCTVLSHFTAELREVSYQDLLKISKLEKTEFAEVIHELKAQNLIVVRANNQVFIKKTGLIYA